MATTSPNPWAELRARPHLALVWTDLPLGVRGMTDGTTIYLARGLSQRERRVTLCHELIHAEMGHTSHQPPAVERIVERETARRLLPDLDQVRAALAWATTLDEAAHELWVTSAVLETRLSDMSASRLVHDWVHAQPPTGDETGSG